jgi:transposase
VRDLSVSYFDCTNYYFDIGRPDADLLDDNGNPVDSDGSPTDARYRKRGPEKNHRPDPIVGMGLLMDRNAIPLAYDLFPGNESEKVHMRPILNRVKNEFSNTRMIIVADRGLNTSDNIYFINGDNKRDGNNRDGYVYGQSVRGADAAFKNWVLAGGYKKDKVTDDDGKEISFLHKSRIFPKEIHVNGTVPGQKKPKKKTVSIDQKQMAYYSEKYAKKQKTDREIMILRAKDLIAHPKKYDQITSKGSAAYVNNIAFDKKTGEIIDGKALSLDMEKIKEEEKYDGYYSIVTSELKMSDHELRDTYRGLSRIEDTFKVSKTEFEARPVYVWTNEHIDAHFATCFTALVILRLLQAKLGNPYPVGKLLDSLRKYSCINLDSNYYQFVYYDEVLEACGKAFDMSLKKKYRTRQEIQSLIRY